LKFLYIFFFILSFT